MEAPLPSGLAAAAVGAGWQGGQGWQKGQEEDVVCEACLTLEVGRGSGAGQAHEPASGLGRGQGREPCVVYREVSPFSARVQREVRIPLREVVGIRCDIWVRDEVVGRVVVVQRSEAYSVRNFTRWMLLFLLSLAPLLAAFLVVGPWSALIAWLAWWCKIAWHIRTRGENKLLPGSVLVVAALCALYVVVRVVWAYGRGNDGGGDAIGLKSSSATTWWGWWYWSWLPGGSEDEVAVQSVILGLRTVIVAALVSGMATLFYSARKHRMRIKRGNTSQGAKEEETEKAKDGENEQSERPDVADLVTNPRRGIIRSGGQSSCSSSSSSSSSELSAFVSSSSSSSSPSSTPSPTSTSTQALLTRIDGGDGRSHKRKRKDALRQVWALVSIIAHTVASPMRLPPSPHTRVRFPLEVTFREENVAELVAFRAMLMKDTTFRHLVADMWIGSRFVEGMLSVLPSNVYNSKRVRYSMHIFLDFALPLLAVARGMGMLAPIIRNQVVFLAHRVRADRGLHFFRGLLAYQWRALTSILIFCVLCLWRLIVWCFTIAAFPLRILPFGVGPWWSWWWGKWPVTGIWGWGIRLSRWTSTSVKYTYLFLQRYLIPTEYMFAYVQIHLVSLQTALFPIWGALATSSTALFTTLGQTFHAIQSLGYSIVAPIGSVLFAPFAAPNMAQVAQRVAQSSSSLIDHVAIKTAPAATPQSPPPVAQQQPGTGPLLGTRPLLHSSAMQGHKRSERKHPHSSAAVAAVSQGPAPRPALAELSRHNGQHAAPGSANEDETHSPSLITSMPLVSRFLSPSGPRRASMPHDKPSTPMVAPDSVGDLGVLAAVNVTPQPRRIHYGKSGGGSRDDIDVHEGSQSGRETLSGSVPRHRQQQSGPAHSSSTLAALVTTPARTRSGSHGSALDFRNRFGLGTDGTVDAPLQGEGNDEGLEAGRGNSLRVFGGRSARGIWQRGMQLFRSPERAIAGSKAGSSVSPLSLFPAAQDGDAALDDREGQPAGLTARIAQQLGLGVIGPEWSGIRSSAASFGVTDSPSDVSGSQNDALEDAQHSQRMSLAMATQRCLRAFKLMHRVSDPVGWCSLASLPTGDPQSFRLLARFFDSPSRQMELMLGGALLGVTAGAAVHSMLCTATRKRWDKHLVSVEPSVWDGPESCPCCGQDGGGPQGLDLSPLAHGSTECDYVFNFGWPTYQRHYRCSTRVDEVDGSALRTVIPLLAETTPAYLVSWTTPGSLTESRLLCFEVSEAGTPVCNFVATHREKTGAMLSSAVLRHRLAQETEVMVRRWGAFLSRVEESGGQVLSQAGVLNVDKDHGEVAAADDDDSDEDENDSGEDERGEGSVANLEEADAKHLGTATPDSSPPSAAGSTAAVAGVVSR